MPGHAGSGVDFQQKRLAIAGAHHHIGAGPATAAQGAVGLRDQALNGLFLARWQTAGAVVLGAVVEVLVLVVVVALGSADADHRQRLGLCALAQHGAGGLVAINELLAQHLRVVAGGELVGAGAFLRAADLAQANGRALARGLDDHGCAQLGQGLHGFFGTGHQAPIGGGQALKAPNALGHDFVHGNGRGHHTRAGVGDAQQFQCPLHRAVFAVAPVQGDEAARVALGFQLGQAGMGGVKGMGIHAHAAQRLQHATAGHQRNLALGRIAAHQHRHLAQCLWLGAGTIRHRIFEVKLTHKALPSSASSS